MAASPPHSHGTEQGLHPGKTPRFNETAIAIIVAMVISAVLATVFTGNPFHVTRMAYLDYSHTPAAPGVAVASDVKPSLTGKPGQ